MRSIARSRVSASRAEIVLSMAEGWVIVFRKDDVSDSFMGGAGDSNSGDPCFLDALSVIVIRESKVDGVVVSTGSTSESVAVEEFHTENVSPSSSYRILLARRWGGIRNSLEVSFACSCF